MKVIKHLTLFLLLTVTVNAQNIMTSSPYSMFGIGEIVTGLYGSNSAMGGVSTGMRGTWLLNTENPAGAYMMNVHYEACTHLHRTIGAIKEAGMKAGVTLNPHTPISLLEDIIQDLDMVLLMSVNPGFGGQRFIEHSVNKTARLKEMIRAKGLDTLIEVDGGVNLETGKRLLEAGADVLVAGSFVFSSPDPIRTIKELKEM